MIRFACPGCSTAFTVSDDKAGKTSNCPKCKTAFQIPDAEDAPAPPPAASPKSAPSSKRAANAPVQIAPCPKCKVKLDVMPEDLGEDVECPECGKVFVARLPGSAPAKSRYDRDNNADDDDRPRRRSRQDDDDDDFEDDLSRKKKKRRSREDKSALSSLVQTSIVFGVLWVICGGLSFLGGAALNFAGNAGNGNPVNKKLPDADLLKVLLMLNGVIYFVMAGLNIFGAMGVSKRQNYGRILLLISGGLCGLLGIARIVELVLLLGQVNVPTSVGTVLGICLLLGFAIKCYRTLLNPDNASAFR